MTTQVTWDPSQFSLEATPNHTLALADDAATRALGAALATTLEPGTFLGLIGTLGAGKTTLVQGMSQASGVDGATSPTYTLVNLYDGHPPIVHMDLYRLETGDDLESIGYWDYVEAADALLCVEWLNHIPDAWPGSGVVLELTKPDNGRLARLWASPALSPQLATLAQGHTP